MYMWLGDGKPNLLLQLMFLLFFVVVYIVCCSTGGELDGLMAWSRGGPAGPGFHCHSKLSIWQEENVSLPMKQ